MTNDELSLAARQALAGRFVTGWLIITEGPGCGAAFEICAGRNLIGRGPENDVVLDFGDTEITFDPMCNIVFDVRSQKHVLLKDGAKISSFLNDEFTVNPIELHGGERLHLGDTYLHSRIFFGQHHDWNLP